MSGTASLRHLLRPYRRRIIGAVVLATATAAPAYLTMVVMGFVVDAVRAGDSDQVVRWSLALAAIALVGAILWIPRAWAVTHAAMDTEADIRGRIFDRILRVDLLTLRSLDVGQIVARGTADLRLIRSFLSGGIGVVAQVIAGYAFLVVSAGYHHHWLGVVALLPVALVLGLSLLRVHRDTTAPTSARDLLGDATTSIDESLQAIDAVRADDARDPTYRKVADLVERARRAMTPVLVRNARFTAVLSSIPYLFFALILAVGAYLIANDELVSLGELVTVSLLMLQVAAPTVALGSTVSEGQDAAAAAERIEEVLAWPDAGADPRTSAADVRVRDLSVAADGQVILRDVDLQLPAQGSLGIQGGTGSGKSTLVQALHGLLPHARGQVAVPRTALVASDDVIFSGSLREAVTYGMPEATEEQVQRAAARAHLDDVVASLPEGWDTQLGGAGGVVLSGGQQQRVRLARGLLLEADLLLLDSATVGLDATTLANVDRGIADERAGRALLTVATHTSNLGPTQGRGTLREGAVVPLPDAPAPAEPPEPTPVPPSAHTSTRATAAQKTPAGEKAPAQDSADRRRHRREAARRRRAQIGVLLRPDRRWIVVAIVAVAVTAVASLVPIYLSMDLLSEITGTGGSARLTAVIVALVVVAVISGLALFGADFLIPWIGQRALARLRVQAFRALLDVHLAYFDRQRVGAIVSKLTNNIELLEDAVRGGARTIVSAIVTLVFVGGLLVILDAELALVAYTVFPVIIVFAVILKRAQRWALSRNIAGISDVTVSLRDAVRGGATIRAYGTQDHHRASFARFNEYERAALLRASYVFKSFAAATQFVVALDIALIVGIGGRDAVSGALAVATMVLFATYLQNGISPISTIATMQAVYGQTGVALDQVVGLTHLPPDRQLAGTLTPDASATFDDAPVAALRFENVWFAYSKAGWVLKDASLDVNRGEHLVVVGRTGGGKSSLVKLGLRFYSPIKGTIEIQGQPLADVSESWLRQQIAYVPQEPTVFTGTVRENLLASRPDAPQAVIDMVIDGLGIQESVIDQLGGLDARISSGGSDVAAGQRQLIAIARALIAQRPILILDEATSHLDAPTEASVIDALRVGDPGRTIIAIAHHLDWAARGDRVAVVARHSIVECGTHDELRQAHGTYARLWAAHGGATPL